MGARLVDSLLGFVSLFFELSQAVVDSPKPWFFQAPYWEQFAIRRLLCHDTGSAKRRQKVLQRGPVQTSQGPSKTRTAVLASNSPVHNSAGTTQQRTCYT